MLLDSNANISLNKPERILFPNERIILGYGIKRMHDIGMINFRNSCYMNASMQALFHVPAFAHWLLTDMEHLSICNCNKNSHSTCMIYNVRKTLIDHIYSNKATLALIVDRPQDICQDFRIGAQEDAHEFVRCLLEKMEKSYLKPINGLQLDNVTKETNPLGQIFGSYMRTEVTCAKCNFVSTTFQFSSELQLDLRGVKSLANAVDKYFRKEKLENNDYTCERCQEIGKATKQFSFEVPPLVLCIQLNRFTLHGHKITKNIACSKSLNMSNYIHKTATASNQESRKRQAEVKYRLVALVIHEGSTPNKGHYTTIAEVREGEYYHFDDEIVNKVFTPTISELSTQAYLAFYEMEPACRNTVSDIRSSIFMTESLDSSQISLDSDCNLFSSSNLNSSKTLTASRLSLGSFEMLELTEGDEETHEEIGRKWWEIPSNYVKRTVLKVCREQQGMNSPLISC